MSSHGTAKGKNLKADLVVVGGGGAGLAAAMAAAEKGASVIVLEKRGLGGNSALAFGIFAAESPAQKRAMIDCRRDDCFKMAMDYAHWRINPRIVRAFIDKSGDTIRWLEEKGLEFDCLRYYTNQVPTWHVPKGGGAEIIKVLAQNGKDLGVQLLTRTPAKKILTGSKGNITGVLAGTKGEEFTITTKSVIIATGGFGGNKKLLKKYCPDYRDNMVCGGVPNTGDGLVMATEIGAATEGLGILMKSGPITLGRVFLTIGTPPNIIRLPLMPTVLEPYGVWVNKKGERFTDEAVIHWDNSNAVARQPDSLTYTIFDSKITQIMAEEGRLTRRLPGGARRLPGGAQAEKDLVKISDSWDEIADWIGADPKVLKATVDEYNAACDHGYDPIFAKDRKYLLPLRTPPYYVIRWHVHFPNTIGGIKVNEHMEVLDKQDTPIPGVYATGVDVGGWESETYCIRLSGSAFGFAVNSGRIAGENAVKFIEGK